MNENLFRFLSSATLLALLLPAGLPAFDPAAGDFTKANSSDIRVMSFNVHNNLITNTSITNNELQRLFTAINPDVIVLNEMTQGITATQIKTTLETYFPSTTWTVNRGISDGFDRCALATRNGLSMQITDTTPASEVRGVVGGLVDVAGSTDLYIMGVHLKCCTDILETHERRQIAADALINWMRDARTAGGNIDLPAGTPMVVLGDLNLGPTGRDDEPPTTPHARCSTATSTMRSPMAAIQPLTGTGRTPPTRCPTTTPTATRTPGRATPERPPRASTARSIRIPSCGSPAGSC